MLSVVDGDGCYLKIKFEKITVDQCERNAITVEAKDERKKEPVVNAVVLKDDIIKERFWFSFSLFNARKSSFFSSGGNQLQVVINNHPAELLNYDFNSNSDLSKFFIFENYDG